MTHMIKLAILAGLAAGFAPAASAQQADASPQGMLAFFMTDTEGCPNGWRASDLARGRVFVGTTSTSDVGVTVADALRDRQPPQHRHALTLKFELKPKSIAGAAGDNEQGAHSGTKQAGADSEPAESGWGFVQLVACEKQ